MPSKISHIGDEIIAPLRRMDQRKLRWLYKKHRRKGFMWGVLLGRQTQWDND